MEEAAAQLAICVNDDAFLSPKGTTKHALWMRLCDMCAKHPQAVSRRLKVDAIIRSGLARFTDETGACVRACVRACVHACVGTERRGLGG